MKNYLNYYQYFLDCLTRAIQENNIADIEYYTYQLRKEREHA